MGSKILNKLMDTDLLTSVIGVDLNKVDLGQYALRAITGSTSDDMNATSDSSEGESGNPLTKLDKILSSATDDILTSIGTAFFGS